MSQPGRDPLALEEPQFVKGFPIYGTAHVGSPRSPVVNRKGCGGKLGLSDCQPHGPATRAGLL